MPTFLHTGKIGDIIYGLPVIKRLGGGKLFLGSGNRGHHWLLTRGVFESIKPLLLAQEYITDVEEHRGQKVAHSFAEFRNAYQRNRTLGEAQAAHVAALKTVDFRQPWLTVPGVIKHGRPVFARTARYQNPDWQHIWPEILHRYPNAIFLGFRGEFEQFVAQFGGGDTEYRPTPTLLDAANVISGASIFVGNQSAMCAIAEGLKKDLIQETDPKIRDCVYLRPNAQHIHNRAAWKNQARSTGANLILALQVWNGDMYQGRDLVKLIADIEPAKRSDVEFAVIYRRDTNPHAVKDIVDEARAKFANVVAIKCRRRGTGWPAGCNDLWQDGMSQLQQLKKSGRIKADAVLTFEPDTIPLRPDWISVLQSEWNKAKGMGKLAVGHAHNEPKTHLNGNAIFSIELPRLHPRIGDSDPRTGWDVAAGRKLLDIAIDSPFCYQKYRIKNISREEVEQIKKGGCIPAIFHGIKSNDGQDAVRSMMADGTFKTRLARPKTEVIEGGKFLISMLALNRLHATKTCVDAVLANSSQEFELVITDNGSTDGTGEYLRDLQASHPFITVVSNEDNQGFIGPNCKAFEMAIQRGARYFVALNNDTVPPAGWLEKLREPLDRLPKAALSGPQGTCCSLHDNFHGHGGSFYEYVEGSCLCVKVDVVKRLGPLFSNYLDFIYGDDSDLSLRVREKGHTIHQVDFVMPHSRGETVMKQPEVKARCDQAQAHNHAVLTKRWAHYLKVRRFDYPIVIRRSYAIGDVLLTTPVIQAIRRSNPLSPVYVETTYPEIFRNNPDVVEAAHRIRAMDGELRIDLDMAYENRPMRHIIEAYREVVTEALPSIQSVELKTQLYMSNESDSWAAEVLKGLDKVCVMHADRGDWPGKNYPRERFNELASYLQADDWSIVTVGKSRNTVEGVDMDLGGETNISQTAAVLSRAKLFIGVDSFPMHAALSVGCPTIGLFGVSSSRFIMTHGAPHIALEADPAIPCAGERHRKAGLTFVSCSPECIESISVESVIQAVHKLTQS